MIDYARYNGKRVLVTGHTGFKGTWLCEILYLLGANVVGYALAPATDFSMYESLQIDKKTKSVIGDIRDLQKLESVFDEEKPEIVFHLAAQPLVRESYKSPVETYETNIMGTVNLLECVRRTPTVKSLVNVTTDKVYKNNEWEWGYRESDELNGADPYSNSKSCSELITQSYQKSFFLQGQAAVSTCRAGNVIGGGDSAKDRIIPDCIRAAAKGETIKIRNPNSIRPYQHVLESLFAYMMVAIKQYDDIALAGSYNIGPNEDSCITTGELVALFCQKWQCGLTWETKKEEKFHEANFLKLDCAKIKLKFGWNCKWDIKETVEKVIEWEKANLDGKDIEKITEKQIKEYLEKE